MKWMKAVLCGVLLGAAGTAASSDEAREQPLDYRQGLMLETSGASPWYRVELPPTIYQGTAWPDLRDVRVLMMTARGSVMERRKGLALGADGFIAKPFELSELRSEMARMLAPPC